MEIFDIEDGKRYVRAFVGIPLPGRFKREFADLLTDLIKIDPDLRLVDEETPHILLDFLGNQTGETLRAVVAEFEESVPKFAGVRLEIGGADHFVNGQREVILLRAHGLQKFGRENKSFSPHLTVARRKARKEMEPALVERLDKIGWSFPVEELAIYGGEIGKQGMAQRILIRLPIRNG